MRAAYLPWTPNRHTNVLVGRRGTGPKPSASVEYQPNQRRLRAKPCVTKDEARGAIRKLESHPQYTRPSIRES